TSLLFHHFSCRRNREACCPCLLSREKNDFDGKIMASSSESSSSVGEQLRRDIPPPKHVIRVMKEEDISQVLEIWRIIGLHEGTQTIQSFMKVDPEGF